MRRAVEHEDCKWRWRLRNRIRTCEWKSFHNGLSERHWIHCSPTGTPIARFEWIYLQGTNFSHETLKGVPQGKTMYFICSVDELRSCRRFRVKVRKISRKDQIYGLLGARYISSLLYSSPVCLIMWRLPNSHSELGNRQMNTTFERRNEWTLWSTWPKFPSRYWSFALRTYVACKD